MLFGKKKDKEDFFDLFDRAAENLVTAANYLGGIISVQGAERVEYRKRLHEVEHQADEITHRINNLLDATFVTPMDRDDISLLASAIDDCMDFMDEAGDLIVLYNLADIPRRLSKQVEVLKECSELTAKAIPHLRTKTNLKQYTVDINSLENQGDRAYRKMLAELFDDSGFDPITIIKIKDIIESLERGVDSFERLAAVVETIYIKES